METKKSLNLNNMPNDQYACTNCKLLPEILKVDKNEGTIVFKCSVHGEKKKELKEYFEEELKYLDYKVKKKNDEKIIIKCPIHKKKYTKYCKNCKLKFCEKDKVKCTHKLVPMEESFSKNIDINKNKDIISLRNVKDKIISETEKNNYLIKLIDILTTTYKKILRMRLI